DCVVDRECTAPKVCTSRGQCVDPTTSGGPGTPPPPPALPAGTVIRAQPSALDFGLLDTKKTLSVTSPNGVMIPFRIVSDRSWLSASPVGGASHANGATVNVSVDRSMLGADRTGQLTINSTAGTITVDVAISSDLSGLYSGNVEMTTPSQAAVRSSLHVTRLEGSGGAITGYVDQERSLLYPRRAGISGTRSGNKVTLTFVMAGA